MYLRSADVRCTQDAFEANQAAVDAVHELTAEARLGQAAFDQIADRPDLNSRGESPATERGGGFIPVDGRIAGVSYSPAERLRKPASCSIPERAREVVITPPGPIRTALPEISLEAMNACQAADAGWLNLDSLDADLRAQCAAAHYLGVSPAAPNIEQGGIALTPTLDTPASIQPAAGEMDWRKIGAVALLFAAGLLSLGGRR